jgi:hypothetical protein
MKIHPAAVELLHTDGRADRQEVNSRSSQFCERVYNWSVCTCMFECGCFFDLGLYFTENTFSVVNLDTRLMSIIIDNYRLVCDSLSHSNGIGLSWYGSHLQFGIVSFVGILTEMSTRNISWGKGGRCVRLTILPPSCSVVIKSGNLNSLEPSGSLKAWNGTALPLPLSFVGILWHEDGTTDATKLNCSFVLTGMLIIP